LTPGQAVFHRGTPPPCQAPRYAAARPVRRPLPPNTATSPAISVAKERARRAYRVCRGDLHLALFAERIWSETLEHVAGIQDAARVEIVFSRTAVLLEILIDRRGLAERRARAVAAA
jgi:hypothetical protein